MDPLDTHGAARDLLATLEDRGGPGYGWRWRENGSHDLRRFITLYIQLLLPFLTGFAYAVFVLRTDYAWHWYAAAGIGLVVLGPLTIRFILMLLAEALTGGPTPGSQPGTGRADDADRGWSFNPRAGRRG